MRFLKVLILVMFAAASAAGQTHVAFDASLFNAVPATNRIVEFQALQPFRGNTFQRTTDSSGLCYISNAIVTDYAFTIRQRGSASQIQGQITVTATNLGVIGAHTNTSVSGAQTYPTSGKSSWSIQASDARYSQIGSGGGSATNVTLRAGTGVAVTTNSSSDWTVTASEVPYSALTAAARLNITNAATKAALDATNGFTAGSGVSVNATNLAQATTNGSVVTINVSTQAVVKVMQNNFVLTNNHASAVTLPTVVAGDTTFSGGTITLSTPGDSDEFDSSGAFTLANGNVTSDASGNLTATSFTGDGSGLTGISSGVSPAQVAAIMATNAAGTVTSVAGNAAQIIPITRSNGVALVYDAKGYGAAGNNSTDDTLVLSNIVKLANWTSASEVGEAYIPKGVYLIRNEILAGGTVGNSSIPNASWQAGYSAIRGSRDAIIRLDANTNAMRTLNGMRMVTISDLIFLGTNYNGAASNNLHNGLVLDGPGGHLTVRDVMAHSFNAGIVLQDITDCDLQNIWCASNFVGLATEYKPDNVRIYGRFERNRYGVMNHWTNLTYTTRNNAGQLLVSGDFGYNHVGVFVSGGHARVGPVYFEGSTHAAIQIGLNSADTYEATYVQTATDAPTVLIDSFDANANSNDIEVYTAATIRCINAKRMEVIDGGVPIRLRNTSADLSTISGDATLTVIDSSSRTWSVPAGWEYRAGEIRPVGGWEDLEDNYVVLTDEFVGGVATSGAIGDLGWTTLAGTPAKLILPVTDWDGKYKLTTGASSNSTAAITLTVDSFVPPYGTNFYMKIRFKIPNTNFSQALVGIQTSSGYELNYDAGGGAARRSAGAFLIYTNGMTTFKFETRQAGGTSPTPAQVDSGVAVNTNWNTLVMTRTNTTIYGSINGGAFTSLGTSALNSSAHYYAPVIGVASGEAASKDIYIDYFKYRSRRIY